MKRKILISSMLALTVCSNLYAKENYVELGLGVINSKDSFSTEGSSTIDSVNSSASSESTTVPAVEFYYGVDISKNEQIYMESQRGEFNFGYSQATNVGLFDVGFIYKLDEESWQNPFSTGTSREKTDVSEKGAFISYGTSFSPIWKSNFVYRYTTVDYENETVIDALKREGNRQQFLFKNQINSYVLNLNLEQYDADGDESSYKQYEVEAEKSFKLSEKISLFTLAGVGFKEYDETNSILNKQIDATSYKAVAKLKYEKPFEVQNSYISFKMGVENEDANHDFYDKENNFALVGFGYRF